MCSRFHTRSPKADGWSSGTIACLPQAGHSPEAGAHEVLPINPTRMDLRGAELSLDTNMQRDGAKSEQFITHVAQASVAHDAGKFIGRGERR